MISEIILGPIIGGLIGGVTNSIAIKMLFRPLNPIKIGSYTIPFTPGVIPKEKPRIAAKIGKVVSEELLSAEVLKEWLLKEEVEVEIERSIKAYLDTGCKRDEIVHDQLVKVLGDERTTFLVCEAESILTEKIYSRVIKMELGNIITDKLVIAYQEGAFSNLLGPMSFLLNEGIIVSLAGKLAPIINNFIELEGEQIISKAIEDESQQIMNTPIGTYAEKIQSYEESFIRIIIKVYQNIIESYLPHILQKIDIAKMIEMRILALDMLSMEKIILSIMQKELKAIVWFGVLLGMIMGLIMSFI